jgi:hypothetical protein
MVRATGGLSKTFLYLDDSLFATWSADSLRAGVVSFFCRPNGRLLSVRQSAVWSGATAGNDGTRSDIATIIAHGSNRERIVLYDDDD